MPLAQLKGVTGGRLNVAVISAGDYFFPRVLAAFGAAHPGITFNLTVHNREGLLRHLADNLTDLAVMVRPPADMDISRRALCAAPVCDRGRARITRWPGCGRFRARRSTASASCSASRARTPGIQCVRCSAASFPRLNIAMQIHSTETIKQAVVAGMGIAFLSAHTIGLDLLVGQPGGARRAGLSGDAELVPGAQPHQALAAGGGGLQGLPAAARGGAHRAAGAL